MSLSPAVSGPNVLRFLALALGTALSTGCDGEAGTDTTLGITLQRASEAPSELGVPELWAATGTRTVVDCPLVNGIDQRCPVLDSGEVAMEIASSACITGACDVRRVELADVASDATTAFFAKQNAPSKERAILFEVTPRTADAVFEVRGRFAELSAVNTRSIAALTVTALDVTGWRAPFQELVPESQAFTVLPGAIVGLPCPNVRARYDGRSNYGPSAPGSDFDGPREAAELQVEVAGTVVATRVDPRRCDGWLTIEAKTVGHADIVVKRRELTQTWAITVASPSDVTRFAVHPFDYATNAFSPIALEELREKGQAFSVACVLGLKDGRRALGGCGTLQPNLASGLVRSGTASSAPEADLLAFFTRAQAPSAGGEVRGRVGAGEVVLPVR